MKSWFWVTFFENYEAAGTTAVHEATRVDYEDPGDDTDVPDSEGTVEVESSTHKEQDDEVIDRPDFKGGGSTLA